MARYKQLVPSPTKGVAPAAASTTAAPSTATTTTGVAAAPAPGSASSNNAAMLNELLGDLLLSDAATAPAPAPASAGNAQNEAKPNSLADLSDIFSSALAESEEKHYKQQGNDAFQPLPGGELLEPQVLVPRKNSASSNGNGDAADNLANGTGQSQAAGQGKRSSLNRKMPAIDMLSEELFQQVLPASQERMSSFKRDPEKLTLNDLVRERMQVKPTEQQPAGAGGDAPDDVPLLSSVSASLAEPKKHEEKSAEAEPAAEQLPTAPAPKEVKHLSEICIELDNIQATGEERVVLDDDDMHLSLNFTEDRPSRHVSVIVIAAQNKSRQPVKDFQFEASVKKVKEPSYSHCHTQSYLVTSLLDCSPARCACCRQQITQWRRINLFARRP